ncbi:uncharacterized protein LOC121604537 isoform X2 [Chelmon rostratus]|uniref:uncharacterized protein LOC121604537 isoform X2 n=1 Tax=Chelmon rostratus TaxID=109905 RepID=UPI001BE5D5D3|nr:uncharacterized protein LOC121604537 isoform X2 [Chelmon rostratus]
MQCSQCFKMMHLCWSTLLLCISVSAEDKTVYQAPGESVTLECSSAGCPRSIEKHSGMTLYWEYEERGEVLYYHTSPGSADKVTPRKGYENRVQTNGSLKNLTVTISSLTVNDTGFYRCVYTKFPSDRVQCNVHKLFVRDGHTSARDGSSEGSVTQKPPEPDCLLHPPSVPECQSLSLWLVIIATCTISSLVTAIFSLLILPRVKRWISSRRGPTKAPQLSTDYVYEVMTKNGLRPLEAPERSEPSPYDFA